jgi:hypothetical protein
MLAFYDRTSRLRSINVLHSCVIREVFARSFGLSVRCVGSAFPLICAFISFLCSEVFLIQSWLVIFGRNDYSRL